MRINEINDIMKTDCVSFDGSTEHADEYLCNGSVHTACPSNCSFYKKVETITIKPSVDEILKDNTCSE